MSNEETLTGADKMTDTNPTAGSLVITDARLENGRTFEALEICDDWAAAAFRLPGQHERPAIAVNVETTGRTVRRISACYTSVIRVRITFVGDCENDVTVGGWMVVA